MKAYLPAVLTLMLGCSSGAVSSNEEAKKAYLGIDSSIDKAITLGFAGFNSASSANISPQTATGTSSGMLTVSGQVDQGSSANKGMRLATAYKTYSDNGEITYDTTATALPALTMQLKGIPTGTLSGSFVGTISMTGAESGNLTLNLSFAGTLQQGAGMAVERAPGTTHVTGTAISAAGTYTVDVTR